MRRQALPLLLAVVTALGALPPASVFAADEPPRPDSQGAVRVLAGRATGPLDVSYHPRTGVVEWLTPAAPRSPLPYTPALADQGDPQRVAQGFLAANPGLFGIRSSLDTFALRRVEPDPRLGWSHVRLDQHYQGVPVFGRQLVVHVDKQGQIMGVNGQFEPGLDVSTEPVLSRLRAHEVALRDLRERQLEPLEALRVQPDVHEQKTRLVVYVDRRGKATLTWQVTILTTSPLGQWYFFVDARRPRVVHATDSLTNARRRITFTAQNTTRIPGRKLADEGEVPRDRIARAAHDNSGVVYDYFFQNFQRDSIDGQGLPIVSTVNFGSDPQDAENAAWIGEAKQMIYGDGGRIFLPLPLELDVVAHELTHGVTNSTSDLIYEGQSGALNESYSDVFGVLIDTANWTLGEDVVKSPPFPVPVLRDMEDPTLGGLYDPNNPLAGIGQPSHVNEFANLPISRRADNGGVHINSGIPNRAMFLVAQALGRERTAQIYYRTLTQLLTPDSDFLDAARATQRAAQDLYGQAEAQAVAQAFSGVGLDIGAGTAPPAQGEDPGPVVPGEPGGAGTPVPIPAGCTDVIVNGGFEGQGGWVEVTSGEFAIISDELPNNGRRSAWLGGQDQEPLQYIYQEVRIPPNAGRVELRFFRLIHQETSGVLGGLLSGDANFGTIIADTRGNPLNVLENLPSTVGDDTWKEASYDLSQFAGQTVRLIFAAENPRGNVSSLFVDDVRIAACTGQAAPSAPPAQSGSTFVQGRVTDANTGRAIEGAQIFVLRPGLSASQAARDDTISDDEVTTYGVSDRRGTYRTQSAVPAGQTYSVIVIARGYRPIIADDGLEVPQGAPNPFEVDVTLRR
jgi:bacillolysin/thermolysin